MIRKIKQSKEEFLLIIILAIFQILLLISIIPTNSYLIHQTDPLIKNLKIDKEKNDKNFPLKIINLLIGFLSIKQIGVVSAQTTTPYCCTQTKDGEICWDIPLGTDLATANCDSNNILPGNCTSTNACQIGTCIDQDEGTCEESRRTRCDNFDPRARSEIPYCKKGCCTWRNNKRHVTATQCEKLSDGTGNWDDTISEEDCRFLIPQTSACVLDEGECEMITEGECHTKRGSWNQNYLCTNPDLGTNCQPTEETTCENDKVYFVDSCGNLANVYDSSKVFDEAFDGQGSDDYWKTIVPPESSCVLSLGQGGNAATCGNCDGLTNVCASKEEAGVNTAKGNYACKDVGCVDSEFFSKHGRNPQNTESWCVYEGYTGDSRDVVGSQHRLRYCDKGEVKFETLCDQYRGRICGERVSAEGRSDARCRFNEGWKCFQLEPVPYEYDEPEKVKGEGPKVTADITNQAAVDEYKAECLNMSDCRIQSVNVDDFFKLELCVPKYPKGFDIDTEDQSVIGENNAICGIASITCPAIYEKRVNAENECKRECKEKYRAEHDGECPKSCRKKCRKECRKWPVANEKCTEKEFVQQMNDLCISLGDCGGYVNVEGKYRKNFEVNEEGYQEDLDETKKDEYKSYANTTIKPNIPENVPRYFSSTEEGVWEGATPKFEMGEEMTDLSLFKLIVGGVGAIASIVTYIIIQKLAILVLKTALANPEPISKIIAVILAAILGAIIGALELRERIQVDVEFTCKRWQPPLGGEDCDKCNDDPLRPCTEYKCESLGTACQILQNVYDEPNPVCINAYPNDNTAPIISFSTIDKDASLYTATKNFDNGKETGVQIRTSDGRCIQEFTPIEFSLITKDENGNDDYAQCVYNWENVDPPNPGNDYALIGSDFNESNSYSIIHRFTEEQEILPSVFSLDNVAGNLGEREGDLYMYVRCVDHAGNPNINEYIVNFCIKEGPDNTVAEIKEYIPASGSYLAYGETSKALTIKLNEPAECRWSLGTDKSYDEMTAFVSCEMYEPDIIKSRWSCTTELEGLTQSQNNIYIKCKDQPWVNRTNYPWYNGIYTEADRNINTRGFPYTLYSTQNPLTISSISPQGTILRGGNLFEVNLEVTTSGGINNGVSTCIFDFIQPDFSWDVFLENAASHSYPFPALPKGDYNILVTCRDDAGNKATGNAIFNLIVDPDPPQITRVFKSGGSLKVITNELAKCYYHLRKCSFNFDDQDAVDMTTALSTEHTADWNPGQKYYIKCEDVWGNKNPSCAIIVSPSYLI